MKYLRFLPIKAYCPNKAHMTFSDIVILVLSSKRYVCIPASQLKSESLWFRHAYFQLYGECH